MLWCALLIYVNTIDIHGMGTWNIMPGLAELATHPLVMQLARLPRITWKSRSAICGEIHHGTWYRDLYRDCWDYIQTYGGSQPCPDIQ